MNDDQKLCAKLSELEKQLHCLQTRNQHRVVDGLLHEAFFEIGRSGRRYDIARPTLRASIWIKTGEAWQMQFHQGTPEAC